MSILSFFSKTEWLNFVLTAVIAATGVVGIILVINSGEDTQKMIRATQQQACAANKNAAAAQSFALSAQGMNQGIGDAVNKLNLQATATTNLPVAAGKQVAAADLANKNRDWPWKRRLDPGSESREKRLLRFLLVLCPAAMV